MSDPSVERLDLGQLLHEAAARHADVGPKALLFDIQPPPNAPDLIVTRQPAILYGLGNIIENAVEFSAQAVTIYAHWNATSVRVTISDDGLGFDESVLDRLGEPYLTTRGAGTAGSRKREGMGLGFFIAKTLLERSGAKVTYANKTSPAHGALVHLEWARRDLEAI